jgi:hypothetical protein
MIPAYKLYDSIKSQLPAGTTIGFPTESDTSTRDVAKSPRPTLDNKTLSTGTVNKRIEPQQRATTSARGEMFAYPHKSPTTTLLPWRSPTSGSILIRDVHRTSALLSSTAAKWPIKRHQQKISFGNFWKDKSLGSWADEMEDFSSHDVVETDPSDKFPLPTQQPYVAHLGNLPSDITVLDVVDFFRDCEVTNVRIVEGKSDHRSKGFGYVEFDSLEGLRKALSYNGNHFTGRAIRISVAAPSKDKSAATSREAITASTSNLRHQRSRSGTGFRCICKALYDFHPQTHDKLGFQKGELLCILPKVTDGDWLMAMKEHSSEDLHRTGLVPNNYVEEAKPTHTGEAIFEFWSEAHGEVTFAEGDTL